MTRRDPQAVELEAAPEPTVDPKSIERAVSALSASQESALTKAAGEGLPDSKAVAEWVERVKRLVLVPCDRAELGREVPAMAGELLEMIEGVNLPDGVVAARVVERFLGALPGVRARLADDVEAAFEGDPAARSFAEIVVAYPSLRAIAIQRIAHELYKLGVAILPRLMTEYAHDRTGIDIHPGARIGGRFFIDHGTGVVIGETTEIGNNVRLYQGVTLGARSPRQGESLRGVKRHPTIEDDVTIYTGATILGGDTVIGRGSVIGGNVWLLESIPPHSRVVAQPPEQMVQRRSQTPARQLQWDI